MVQVKKSVPRALLPSGRTTPLAMAAPSGSPSRIQWGRPSTSATLGSRST